MSLKITTSSLSRFYSALLAWLPILSIYRSFIPGVSIAELLLVICALFSMVLRNDKTASGSFPDRVLGGFTIYCIIVTLFSVLIGTWFDTTWLHRVLRFSFYMFCALYSSRGLFDTNTFFKHANYFSWALFIGIAFQYVAYYGLGRYVRLYGNLFPLMTDNLLTVNYENIFSYSAFRPSSLLTEPSHIAQYVMIPFIYNLYKINDEKEGKYVIRSIIIGLTILLSKSLWGYFLLILIMLFWLLDSAKERHSIGWYIIIPVALIIGAYTVFNSSLWADTFSRLDIKNLQGSLAFTGRFTGYEDYFQLPFNRILFGSGFGAVIRNQVTNSVLFILVGEGLVGITLIIITMIGIFGKIENKWQRTLCTAFCFLLFGSNIFFSTSIIIIFTLLSVKQINTDVYIARATRIDT